MPAADRNLLFGVVALQMDFITQGQLVAAMNAWALDKAQPLAALLEQHKALSADRRALLEALVAEHLKQHDGDAEKSLASLPGVSTAKRRLQQLDDADIQASLVHRATPRGESASPAGADQPDDPYATAPAPQRSAGRFTVLRPHASGGLGQVSVALDQELERQVALKEIKEKHVGSAEARSRFVLEAMITGRLEHPGVVPVYSLGHHTDGRPFYAMRFIKGDSLKEAIDRFHGNRSRDRQEAVGAPPLPDGRGSDFTSLEFRKLLGRFIDVCNAIAYAHSRGVLHRDIKPGNIMLGPYGETLVVDWGLAKTGVRGQESGVTEAAARESTESLLSPASGSGSSETLAGSALGTPAYMSPEQAAGKIDELGQATDVYSLGATLYELLTGKAPFAGKSDEVLAKVQAGDFPPPRLVQPAVPAPLEAVCLKAMARSPADRYASTRELADEIERWLADEPVRAWPEPWAVKFRRWTSRHRVLVSSAAACLAVATVALVIGIIFVEGAYAQAREDRQQAIADRAQAEEDRGKADKAKHAALTSAGNEKSAREMSLWLLYFSLDQRLRGSTTPKDNANVLLWQAYGPHTLKMSDAYFERLGIERPPEEGRYFIPLEKFVKADAKAKAADPYFERLDHLQRRPWTPKEAPEFDAWINANRAPLRLVTEATQRPNYYSPLLPPRSDNEVLGLLGAQLPTLQCRDIARALIGRAMRSLGNNRHSDAWQDLLTCHRLARLIAQGGTLLDILVAIAIEQSATGGEVALLASGGLDAAALRKGLADLQKLPPLPSVADPIDYFERFNYIELVLFVQRDGEAALDSLTGGSNRDAGRQRTIEKIDWNATLRTGIGWYDRVIVALRTTDRAARDAQIAQIDQDMKSVAARAGKAADLETFLSADGETPQERGKRLGDLLTKFFLPAFGKVTISADRHEQGHRNLLVAFALAIHRQEHGRYPETLDELAPAYLPAVPLDLFSGKALIYRPTDNGYLLYSVGVNRQDDQGRSATDNPPGDDLPIRIPPGKE